MSQDKHDPGRWLETGDVDPDLLEALEAAQSDFPSDAQLAAVEASILGTIGGGGGGGGSGGSGGPTSIPPAAGVTISPAIPAALVALGLVAGAVAFLWPNDPAPPSPAVESPPMVVVEEPAEEPAPTPASSGPVVEAPPEPEPTTAPATPLDEGELLERARRRVRSNPAGALRLLRTHRRRFPAGVLSEERDALWVEALHRRGRVDDARTSFDAFVRAYPGSVHRVRLRSLFTE